jgi:hypothetical protein
MGSKQSASPALLCGKLAVTPYGTWTHDKLDTLYMLKITPKKD